MAVALSPLAGLPFRGARRDSYAGNSASTTCGPLVPGRSATIEYSGISSLFARVDGENGDDHTVPQYPHDLPLEVELEAMYRNVPTLSHNGGLQLKVSDILLSRPWAWTGRTEERKHNFHGQLPTPPQTTSATSILPDDCRSRNQSTELSSMHQDSLSDDGDVMFNHAGESLAHELASNDSPSQYRPLQSITITQRDIYSPIEFSPPQGSDELSIALQQYIPNAATQEMRIEQIIQDFKEWRSMFAPKGPATRRYDITPKLLLKMKFYCSFHSCSHSKTGFSTQYDLEQHEKRCHYQVDYVHNGFWHRKFISLGHGGSATNSPYSPSETHSDDSGLRTDQDLKLGQIGDILDGEEFPILEQALTGASPKKSCNKELAAHGTPSKQEKHGHCSPSTVTEDSCDDDDILDRRLESILHELFPENLALASSLALALNASSEGDVTLLDRIRSATLPTKQHGGEHNASSFTGSTIGATPSSNTTGMTYKTNFSSLSEDGNGGFGDGEQNDPPRPGLSGADPEARGPEKRLRCHFPGCTKDYKSYNNLLDHRTRIHLREGFRCPRCSSCFPTATELTNHLAEEIRCEYILVEHNTIDQAMHNKVAEQIQKTVTQQWSFTDAPDNDMKVWITNNREEFIGSKLISAKDEARMERDLAKWYIAQDTMYPAVVMPSHPFPNLISAASANWTNVIMEQARRVIDCKRDLHQRPPTAPKHQDQWYLDSFQEALRICQAMQSGSSTSTRKKRGRHGPHPIVVPGSNNVENSDRRVETQQRAHPSLPVANSSLPVPNLTIHADQETPVIDAQCSPMMAAPPLPLAMQNTQRQSGERNGTPGFNQFPIQQPITQPSLLSLLEQQQLQVLQQQQQRLQALATSHEQQQQQLAQAINRQARDDQMHQAVPQKRTASYPATGQPPSGRRRLNPSNTPQPMTSIQTTQRPPLQIEPHEQQPSWPPVTPNSAARLGQYGPDGSLFQSSQAQMAPIPAPGPDPRQQDSYQNQKSQVPLSSGPHPDSMNPHLTGAMGLPAQSQDLNFEQNGQNLAAQNQPFLALMPNDGSAGPPTDYCSLGGWDSIPEMDTQFDGAI